MCNSEPFRFVIKIVQSVTSVTKKKVTSSSLLVYPLQHRDVLLYSLLL